MRRIPTTSLLPGMKVGHSIYNSRGEMLINRGVVLNNRYINSLLKLGIPVIYIIDEDLPEFYVEDVIDERTRTETVNLARKILKGTPTARSPLDNSLLTQAKTKISDIIDELLQNNSIMVNMVDIRSLNDYLFSHSVNVCVLSLITGISLNYDRNKLMDLGMGALMHDIGKTLLPSQILNKPGALTQEEFEVIKHHPEYGYSILNNGSRCIKKICATIALQHHERGNGEGYPKGLYKDSIHELSQIVGIADIYDAITADRVYRKACPPNEAYELIAGSGDFFFDYKLVQAFLSNIAAYPAGSIVELSSNEIALVIETTKGFSIYPKIKILYDVYGNKLTEPVDMDLSRQKDRTIVRVLEHEEIEELKQNNSYFASQIS